MESANGLESSPGSEVMARRGKRKSAIRAECQSAKITFADKWSTALPCGVASNCKVHFHANRSSAVGVALALHIFFLPTALSLEVDNTQADSLSFVLLGLSQLSDVVTLLFLSCFVFFSLASAEQ